MRKTNMNTIKGMRKMNKRFLVKAASAVALSLLVSAPAMVYAEDFTDAYEEAFEDTFEEEFGVEETEEDFEYFEDAEDFEADTEETYIVEISEESEDLTDEIFEDGFEDEADGFFDSEQENESVESVQEKLETPKLLGVEEVEKAAKLSWEAVEGVDQYRVFRKTTDTEWEVVGETAETAFTDDKVEIGVKYSYTVCCLNTDGTEEISDYDEEGLEFEIAVDETKIAEIQQIVSTEIGVQMLWGEIDNVNEYQIYRKGTDDEWKLIATTEDIYFVDEEILDGGEDYSYVVCCEDAVTVENIEASDSIEEVLEEHAEESIEEIVVENGADDCDVVPESDCE